MLGGIKCIPHSSPEDGLGGMVPPENLLLSEPGKYQLRDVNRLWKNRNKNSVRNAELILLLGNSYIKHTQGQHILKVSIIMHALEVFLKLESYNTILLQLKRTHNS